MATPKGFDVGFRLRGAAELEKLLRQLPAELQANVQGQAVRAGAKVWQDAARDAAPVGAQSKGRVRLRTTKRGQVRIANYGKLKLSIGVRVTQKTERGALAQVHIGKAFWGRFLEFGTSKMRARPWFRAALDTSATAAIDAMGAALARGIDRAAKKLASKLRLPGR